MAKPDKRKAKKRSAARPAAKATPDPGATLESARPFRLRERRDLIALGIVLGVALVLRLVFFYFNQRNNPVFTLPIMDALFHHEWAQDIIAGRTKIDDVYFRGPLYPYLLSFLYRVSGESIPFAVFFQHLMGTATCGFIYVLAREYFDRRVSFLAGLGAALYWPFVYFEGDLLIVTTILLLNTISLWLLAKGLRTGSLPALGGAGLVLGLSAIARPSLLIFFPAIPLVVFLARKQFAEARAGWVARSAVVLGTTLVAIMPVMIRNYVVARAVVPVAASGGVNFYIGNNPASDGSTAIVPGTRADWWGGYYDAIAIAERDEGRKLDLAEVSDYYFDRGMQYIGTRPGPAFSHMFKKFRFFWAGPERANNKFIYFFWNLAGMKYVPLPGFWLVAPLALLGFILQWRRRRLLAPLYLFVLLYMLGVVAFFVNARFRLPVLPVLIIFAAFAVHYLIQAYRQRTFAIVRAVGILAVAAIWVNIDYLTFAQVRNYSNAFSHTTMGNAYMKLNMKDTALGHYQKAIDLNQQAPTDAFNLIARDVYYNMGNLYWEQGLCSRAIDALRMVGGSDQYAVTALEHLGDCYLQRGEVQRATSVFNELLRISPGDIRGVTGMAQCQARMGNLAEAERMLESVVDPTRDVYPPAYIALAEVQRALGKVDAAIKSFTDITRFLGYERDAYIALIELYQSQGNIDAARRALADARPYFPPGDPMYQNLVNMLSAQE